ncbi:ATP-binding protein [Sphingobacterium corticis]|uniref:histidine kinase n=1 Tax=Sphingobacterium corticis TaxID=1812823 RepID=A0ABW5NIW6_9SPHI
MNNLNPIPSNELERLRALEEYEILDSLSEEEFDRITELASLICNTPISLITLLDEKRQWFKSKKGLVVTETPREIAFCQYTIMNNEPFEVPDAQLDERFADNILVTQDPHIRFYAGFPLTDPAGLNLGTLCVIDRIPRELTDEQRRSLRLLANGVMTLIVERRQKEQFRNFERLFTLSPDLIGIYKMDTNMIRVNPAYRALTGIKNSLIEGDYWYQSIHRDDQMHVLTAFQACNETKSEAKFTIRVKAADETYRFVEWILSLEHKTNQVFAMGRDVTDSIALKQELERTAQLLEETNEVARIGGWEFDINTAELRWTAVTKKIHAVPADFEPTIENAILFYKEPEVRMRVKEAVDRAIATGEPWSMEVQIVDSNGKEIWVRAIGKAEMCDGNCNRLFGTFQDIDEKKKVQIENANSRAVLQAFVKHAPAAVAMFDRELRYIAVSNEWINEYELQDQQIIGRSHYDVFPFIPPEGRARHERVLNGAVEQNDEDLILLKDSPYHGYTAWEMRPWYKIDGEIGGIMIFTKNVSHQVEQREQLEEAKAIAESASRAKSEFLANMSHELRTPLNGILGFAELALDTDTDESRRQYLELVIKSGYNLLQVINDILDYSKLEGGTIPLQIERTDLQTLVKKSINGIAMEGKQKGISVRVDNYSDIPRYIWTDSMRLRQILNNLLNNAIKFTEAGEVLLSIQLLGKDEESSTLRFSISDTGIGIRPENQQRIFDAFAQEDGSVTRKYGGTGLGLTVSNKLLETMGSALKLKSTVDVGSVFSFDITARTSEY